MFLRLLFVLLIALNIAVGAWLVLGQNDAYVPSVADPGVPVLRLLSEERRPAVRPPAPVRVPAPAASAPALAISATSSAPLAPTPAPASSSPEATSYRCLALGPFATAKALGQARSQLAGRVARSRSRQEQSQQSRGWWVYLPAQPSRAQALAQAQRLAAANIEDYFVVSSGDQPNTISLGLFMDPANARNRRDQLVAAGFPARMSERVDTVPEYWLDVVIADGAGNDWRQQVRDLGAGIHSTDCF